MKKKLISLLLLTAMVASLCSCAVIDNLAVLQKSTDGMTYKEVDGEIHITGYSDKTTVTELTIPDEIDGKPVTVIADFGVCNADSLKVITLGKNVREIGTWGLTNNQHLAAFEVAEGNETFTAFDGVLFSADGKILYNYPCGRGIEFDRFGMAPTDEEGKSVYVDYDIPEGVEVVRDKAFYKCYYVNVSYFPDSIREIREKAFHRCSSLQRFCAPDDLEWIGKDAFSYNENMTEVVLGEKIRKIDDYAFFCCKNLKKLYIMASEGSIEYGEKWKPSDKGKELDDLTLVYDVGAGNEPLILYHETEEKGEKEDDGCKKEKEAEKVLCVVGYIDGTGATEVAIPDEADGKRVTAIADYAFRHADSLTSVKIGKNVKEIGEWAFTENKNLASIEVDGGNECFTSVDGVLFTADKKTLCCYPAGKGGEGAAYTVPDGVEVIRGKAFFKCAGLTVTLPDSLKEIGNKAFAGCEALKELALPETLTVIGSGAFAYCRNLTSVTVGKNIKTVGGCAFFECESLRSVKIDKKKEDVTLGACWEPTVNGKAVKDVVVSFAK